MTNPEDTTSAQAARAIILRLAKLLNWPGSEGIADDAKSIETERR